MSAPHQNNELRPSSLWDFIAYFLRLGTFGFGGPVVLVGHMQRDLVDEKAWISKSDYNEGLALAQLAPGPLAAQLAIYIGWIKARVLGATLVGLAFILPSLLIVIALSWLYVRFGGLSWIQGAFYGIGAAVIAIIAQSALKLTKRTLENDVLLWAIFTLSAIFTVVTEFENLWLFLACGIAAIFIKARSTTRGVSCVVPAWLLSGLSGTANPQVLRDLGLFFLKSGAVVFGSGLAIVPFLHGGVVQQFHWLNERQFIDAVAVAMITPGPVVITVAFIGFLVAGLGGALVAALGIFLPCYLFVVLPAPYYRRFAGNKQIKSFVDGVTAAAVGSIAGAAVVLSRRSITDIPTTLIALVVFAVLYKTKKVPEPLLILGAGLVGFLIKSLV